MANYFVSSWSDPQTMMVIGIDPGLAHCGWGVVRSEGNHYRSCAFGSIETPAHTPLSERLLTIYDTLMDIFRKYKPELVAVEELYMKKNISSAIAVSHARGVILLAGINVGAEVVEFSAKEIKQAVVGYGQADKQQVQKMTALLLNMNELPRPDHAADALAVAISAINSSAPSSTAISPHRTGNSLQ